MRIVHLILHEEEFSPSVFLLIHRESGTSFMLQLIEDELC